MNSIPASSKARLTAATLFASPAAGPSLASIFLSVGANPPDTDAEILALRAEFVRLNDIYQPLNDAAWEECNAFRAKYEEIGWEAACAWSKATARYYSNDSVEQMGVELSRILERMLDLRPTTLAGIAATAATLMEDQLTHLWDEPENDRDWDIRMLTRFIDGLIESASSTKV
jgi:hypothetical protein